MLTIKTHERLGPIAKQKGGQVLEVFRLGVVDPDTQKEDILVFGSQPFYAGGMHKALKRMLPILPNPEDQEKKAKGQVKERPKRIYIATSWKMEPTAKAIADALRQDGHEVDCFCDPSSGRYVFHWTEFVDKEEDLQNYDAVSFLNDPRTRRAFEEDKGWIDWCDVVVMVHPCGKSAHLEAGYAKGSGKKVFMYGEFPKGQFDVMYGFADGLYRVEQFGELKDALKQ